MSFVTSDYHLNKLKSMNLQNIFTIQKILATPWATTSKISSPHYLSNNSCTYIVNLVYHPRDASQSYFMKII